MYLLFQKVYKAFCPVRIYTGNRPCDSTRPKMQSSKSVNEKYRSSYRQVREV